MNAGDAMDKLKRIRGVSWRWKQDAPADAHENPGIGVVAQEVEAVFPDLVETGPDGLKRVNYMGLVGPLIEAVKELDARLTELEEREARRGKP
jgi:trimeric autotransporter adhesin